jgi:hypothetical protein
MVGGVGGLNASPATIAVVHQVLRKALNDAMASPAT